MSEPLEGLRGFVPLEQRIALDEELSGRSEEGDAAQADLDILLRSVVSGPTGETQSKIAKAEASAKSALATDVARLNDRIGKRPPVVETTDATPTVIATLTPSAMLTTRIAAKVVAHRFDRRELASYDVVAVVGAVPSLGTLTLAGTPVDGDQVEIDGVTYTFEAVITPGTPFEVASGGSASVALDNLIAAINQTGTDDVEYGAGTTKHPTFSGFKASASTMEAVALVPGLSGDGKSTTDTEAGVLFSWGGAVTAGGSDMTVHFEAGTPDFESAGISAADVTVNASLKTVQIKGTGVAGRRIKWRVVHATFEIL